MWVSVGAVVGGHASQRVRVCVRLSRPECRVSLSSRHAEWQPAASTNTAGKCEGRTAKATTNAAGKHDGREPKATGKYGAV